jgi:IclR family transcriptional regulator, KDG regulon repressor
MRDVNMGSIRSIERAIDVIESFAIKNKPLTMEEIAAYTKLPKSTVYRILCTLEKRHLVIFDDKNLRYQPGIRLLELGIRYTSFFDIKKEAEDTLTLLHLKTNQTILMAVHAGDQISYIYRRENEEGLKVSSGVSERQYYYGVLGPILLAFLPETQIEHILSKPHLQHSSTKITDLQLLRSRIKQIREEKFYFESDETHVGATAFGAPIFGSTGEVIAAAGIIMPTIHFNDEKYVEYKRLLLNATKQISEKLGFFQRGTIY